MTAAPQPKPPQAMQTLDTHDLTEPAIATRRPPPEIVMVLHHEVYCDGSGYGELAPAQAGGGMHKTCANIPAALGHPRVYLTIPGEQKFIDCTYCDRRFLVG